MGDKQNAARVAWATIKLSQVGQRPVSLDQLATQLGLTTVETARLLRLTCRARVDLRDGMVRLDATPAGPRRYRVYAGGRTVGSFRCGPSTPKPAASSTGWRPQRQPPHCRERGRR